MLATRGSLLIALAIVAGASGCGGHPATVNQRLDSDAAVVAAFRAEGINLATITPSNTAEFPAPQHAYLATHAGTPTSLASTLQAKQMAAAIASMFKKDGGHSHTAKFNSGSSSISIFNVFVYIYRSDNDATEAKALFARSSVNRVTRRHNVLLFYLASPTPPASWIPKIRRALVDL